MLLLWCGLLLGGAGPSKRTQPVRIGALTDSWGPTPIVVGLRDGLQELGYHVVIIPSDTQRAAIRAMQRVLATIARDGSAAAMIDDMASFKDREAVVDTAGYLARDRRYSA